MACANFQFKAAITGAVTSVGPKGWDDIRENKDKKAKKTFCLKPLVRSRSRPGWKIGQRRRNYRRGCLPQTQLHVQLCLSFPTSSPALIAILPLLSSLNLSDYSHEYTGTTTIYNHPLVSPCLTSTKPQAAHLFMPYLLPLWVDFAFYLPVNDHKRWAKGGLYIIGCGIGFHRSGWTDHRFFPSWGGGGLRPSTSCFKLDGNAWFLFRAGDSNCSN